LSEGGDATAFLKGSVDFAQKNAFVRVGGPRSQNLAGPGFWIVETEEGKFYALSDTDFQILYVPEPTQEGEA
jgi:L-ascorbate metabolism protein UlaG (beta-lactamase superfamily)